MRKTRRKTWCWSSNTRDSSLPLSIIFYYHKLNCKGGTLSHPRRDSEIILNLSRHCVVVKQEQIVAWNDDYPFTLFYFSSKYFTIRNNHTIESTRTSYSPFARLSMCVRTFVQKPTKRTRMMRASQVHLVTNAQLYNIRVCVCGYTYACACVREKAIRRQPKRKLHFGVSWFPRRRNHFSSRAIYHGEPRSPTYAGRTFLSGHTRPPCI